MEQRFFCGNLSYRTNEEGLREFFNENGFLVETVAIIRDMETNRSKGFGFVTINLTGNDTPDTIIKKMSGKTLEGRAITVNVALPKKSRGKESAYKD